MTKRNGLQMMLVALLSSLLTVLSMYMLGLTTLRSPLSV
jgi:hypothetical protein